MTLGPPFGGLRVGARTAGITDIHPHAGAETLQASNTHPCRQLGAHLQCGSRYPIIPRGSALRIILLPITPGAIPSAGRNPLHPPHLLVTGSGLDFDNLPKYTCLI